MHNWGADIPEDDGFINADLKWKKSVKTIEAKLQRLKQETDKLAQKLNVAKRGQCSYEGVQAWIHKLTDLCDEITVNLTDLSQMVPKDQIATNSSKKMEMKELSRRATQQMKLTKDISFEMQKELEKSYKAKKLRASMTSFTSGGNDDGRLSGTYQPGYQMSALADPQMLEALEEEKQCEQLLNDLLQLGGLVVKVAEMIHEQGEVVDLIEARVEDAYQNVEVGVKHLENAVESKEAANKKKLCIVIIVVIVLAVIALIIGLSIKYA